MHYADIYDPDTDFDRWHTLASADALTAWVRPGDEVLELGCATGLMTDRLVRAGAGVLAVDHAEPYLERARARNLPGVEYRRNDIVAFDAGRAFDHVVAANVIHEVADVEAFLATCRRHLKPAGLLHLSLQNPRSIHRLVGHEMGVIGNVGEVSPRGERYQTLRMMTRDELSEIVREAGFREIHHEGILVKPLPNAMMVQLPEAMLLGFVRAARHLPDLCSMNYLIFTTDGDRGA